MRFDPSKVRAWLSEKDHYSPSDERGRQLTDIAETGDEDNSEVSRDELERRSFTNHEIHLPFHGKLTWSLLHRIPAGTHVISMICNPDGSSVFTGHTGEYHERHLMWVAIRKAGADQRNCMVTTDIRAAEVMATPFPNDPGERTSDFDLRCSLLCDQPQPAKSV